MSEDKATPRPWNLVGVEAIQGEAIRANNGYLMAVAYNHQYGAEILRAVNAHDYLVAALQLWACADNTVEPAAQQYRNLARKETVAALTKAGVL